MIEGLLLIVLGLALIALLVVVLRSERARRLAYRAAEGLRSLARLRPVDPETFSRQLEAGIYVGMCVGALLVILGALTAAS